jgi:hypothetical protein
MSKIWIAALLALGAVACSVETEPNPDPTEKVGQTDDPLMKRSCKSIARGDGSCDVVCCTVTCNGFDCTSECSTTYQSRCSPIIYDPGTR